MLAEWLRERDQRKVEEAEKRGREEVDRLWEVWYERQQAAFREGKPFDEPPPISAKPSTYQ